MKIDERGWLATDEGETAVKRYPTVRTYELAAPAPLGIVWHYTAGRGGAGFAEGLAKRAQTFRRGIDRPASWHVLIAKDGVIYQSAPFNVGTWHVGRPGVIAGRRFDNINHATIGCELENAGRLRKLGDRVYCWPYYVNPEAPEYERRPDQHYALELDRAVVTNEGLFDTFTSAQEVSATLLLRALVSRFGWTREVSMYGHVDFDPARKEDPGPIWKRTVLPRVLDKVFGGGAVASASTTGAAGKGG
jgi:N-acetyl-anhydromuramyl-L-alanine amidase AmpD